MTDPILQPAIAPGAVLVRPTSKSEWTLIGALIAALVLAIFIVVVLTFPRWPDLVAPARIHFLGWGLLIALGGILLVIIAIISPWVGTVKASGMGAQMEIDGDGDKANA